MIFTSRSYAIGRAHFQIAGGLRTLLMLGAGYVALALALLGVLFYNVERPIDLRVWNGLYTFIMAVEGFVLLLFGSIRISGTMRLDVSTNMIESHRLMPVPAWRAILGYMFGSTAHVLLITALNVLLLVGIASQTRLPFSDFVINQLVLGLFALFVWSFSAVGSLMPRQVMPLIMMSMIVGSVGSAMLRNFGILPGVSLLGSPFLGETIFTIMRGRGNPRLAYPWALSAQLAFAGLFFMGAARRYRGWYASTFNIGQALALGIVWGVLSAVSIANWQKFNPMGFFQIPQPEMPAQIVASLAVAAVLAIVPAHALMAYQKRKPLEAWVVALVLLASTAICLLTLSAAHLGQQVRGATILAVTSLVMAAHVAIMYLAFRATRGMTAMATATTICTLIFVIWIIPLIAELARWTLIPVQAREEAHFSIIGTLSPLGLLINQWTGEIPLSPVAGLAFQWAAVFGVWRMAVRLNRAEKPGFPVVMATP